MGDVDAAADAEEVSVDGEKDELEASDIFGEKDAETSEDEVTLDETEVVAEEVAPETEECATMEEGEKEAINESKTKFFNTEKNPVLKEEFARMKSLLGEQKDEE